MRDVKENFKKEMRCHIPERDQIFFRCILISAQTPTEPMVGGERDTAVQHHGHPPFVRVGAHGTELLMGEGLCPPDIDP